MIQVILVIAHTGFQPIEYGIPKDILTQAGFTVITASNKSGRATDSMGQQVKVDTTIAHINPADYDALFFVGGPGAMDNLDNQQSYNLIKAWAATGKPFGAICISPRILAHAGVLKGKKVTGWDDDHELAKIFKKYDVNYIHRPVVVDGTVITATGPMAAEEFGHTIVKVLKK